MKNTSSSYPTETPNQSKNKTLRQSPEKSPKHQVSGSRPEPLSSGDEYDSLSHNISDVDSDIPVVTSTTAAISPKQSKVKSPKQQASGSKAGSSSWSEESQSSNDTEPQFTTPIASSTPNTKSKKQTRRPPRQISMASSQMHSLNTSIEGRDAVKMLLDNNSQELLNNWANIQIEGKQIISKLFWSRSTDLQQLEFINFNRKKILSNLCQAIKNKLLKDGFITGAPSKVPDNLDSCIELLALSELNIICSELELAKPKSKSDAVLALKSHQSKKEEEVLEKLQSTIAKCYRLSDHARITFNELYILMHLGIFGMDCFEDPQKRITSRPKLTLKPRTFEISIIDEHMEMDKSTIVFRTRDEFLRYYKAYDDSEKYFATIQERTLELKKKKEMEKQMKKTKNKQTKTELENQITEQNEKIKDLENKLDEFVLATYSSFGIKSKQTTRYKELPLWLRKFTPAYCDVEILDYAVKYLKETKKHDYLLMVLDLLIEQLAFKQHKKAYWYAEKVLILHKHKHMHLKAAETLLEGFKAATTVEDNDYLRPRSKGLFESREVTRNIKDQLEVFVKHNPLVEYKLYDDDYTVYTRQNKKAGSSQRSAFKVDKEDGTEETVTAEEYCSRYYSVQFPNGEWWHGKMVMAMFRLLFWDIIYTKPVGIVGIFLSRYQNYPLDFFSEYFYTNRKTLIDERLMFIEKSKDIEAIVKEMARHKDKLKFISDIDWKSIEAVAPCLGPRALAVVCRRLARNYRHGLGFPDLTLWNERAADPKDKIKFLEVKTKDDKPKIHQMRWLQYLREHGVNAGLCYLLSRADSSDMTDDTSKSNAPSTPPDSTVNLETKNSFCKKDSGYNDTNVTSTTMD